MITNATILRRAADVRFRAVDDETVVIRQEAAEALVLNEVAGRILELVDGERTVGGIVKSLLVEYDVSHASLTEDVHTYLLELLEAGVLTGP